MVVAVRKFTTMLDQITPFDALMREANEMQKYLDETTSEQINDVLERGEMLAGILSRSGKMVADAEYHRDNFQKSEIVGILKDTVKLSLPALVMKQLVESACKDYNYLCKRCESINRTAVHQLDWCRTVISNAKSEREASKGFNSQHSKQQIF